MRISANANMEKRNTRMKGAEQEVDSSGPLSLHDRLRRVVGSRFSSVIRCGADRKKAASLRAPWSMAPSCRRRGAKEGAPTRNPNPGHRPKLP